MLKLLMPLALLCLPALVHATSYTVHSSNSGFNPSNLTINAGDTVTFQNDEGRHNVHATSGPTLFKCSDDCGSNSDASSNKWSATITFPTAGTVKYQCDPHVSMGMVGSIVVNATTTTPAIALGGYLSGNWFNPAQGGHGFQFEFTNQADEAIPSQKEMIAIWFVYTPDGAGQNWIYAQGPYDSTSNTVTLPAAIFHGAKFPFPQSNYDPNALLGTLGDWGTLTFTFSDCDHANASWTSNVAGYGNGSIPITRITSIQGTACPAP